MPDTSFAFEWVPNRYEDRAQRAAVLYPLGGYCRSPRQVVEATDTLVRRWRAKLTEWVAIGHSLREAIQPVRNCLPAFAFVRPRSRACRVEWLCPFCYARWVREVWTRVDGCFPNDRGAPHQSRFEADGQYEIDNDFEDAHVVVDGALRVHRLVDLDMPVPQPATPSHHLASHFCTYSFPYLDPAAPDVSIGERVRCLMGMAIEARYRRIRQLAPVGGVSHMTVEPTKAGWMFRLRELFKIDAAKPLPEWRGTWHRCESPTRKNILQAVIKLCRYPTRLLTGDPEQVARLLIARRGVRSQRSLRLTATYGEFRESTNDD